MYKPALISGSIFAMLSVVLGAFGAHYLKTIFTPEILSSFETGVKYQMYHSLALLFTGIISMNIHQKAKLITILFITGIVLFSGSIYALCILKSNLQIGLGGLGILTPIGGVFFIMGWGLHALNIAKSK
jgi:uncharacterized membrane protein YgdD (TMEM256/DUF423 family)